MADGGGGVITGVSMHAKCEDALYVAAVALQTSNPPSSGFPRSLEQYKFVHCSRISLLRKPYFARSLRSGG
tara:strand:- start:51 stop:263 length:213 start_codon:yes stop_codon:yes gene_type:complete